MDSSSLNKAGKLIRSAPSQMTKVLLSVLALVLLLGKDIAQASDTSLLENWNADTSPYFALYELGNSHVHSNVAEAGTSDGKALQLELAPDPEPGPGGGPEIESLSMFHDGIYTARLKTTDCSAQPLAGVVTGYFVYFNDGNDYNGNGLPDNSEIDFEWLCAEPESLYLTLWTDYRESDARHRRVTRKINLSTGDIEYTCYYESYEEDCQVLMGNEGYPASVPAITGYNSSSAYYEYGFKWTGTRVTWWVVNPATGQQETLWDYMGPSARIPKNSAQYMVNVWHTDDWTPESKPTAKQSPPTAMSAYVDWIGFDETLWLQYIPLIVH